MAAPVGNDYWRLRTKDGRDKIYGTPEELADAANEYFEWIEENPLVEVDFRGKDSNQVRLPRMRSMTMSGLCNFLDIAMSTFQEYEKRKGFTAITTRIRQIIETQQFEGAAAGFLNPNIIARKLGLSEKTEGTVTNLNVEVSKEEAKAIAASLKDEV